MNTLPQRQPSLTIFDVVRSTNESVMAAGRNGKPEGTTHLARCQTHGRGRSDHRWWSPRDGGLWMSVLLRPIAPRQRWGGLTLVAASAVYDVVRGRGVNDLQLYWPNDLQVGRRKLGGLLGEIGTEEDQAWVALGIGLNLQLQAAVTGEEPPPELRESITSLQQSGAAGALDAPSVALEVLEQLWPLYDAFQAGASVAELVGPRLAHVGGFARVRIAGQPERCGSIIGLGPLGELLVDVSKADSSTVATGGDAGPLGKGEPRPSLSAPDVLCVVSGDVTYEDGRLG